MRIELELSNEMIEAFNKELYFRKVTGNLMPEISTVDKVLIMVALLFNKG
jgi:hypothetical protein